MLSLFSIGQRLNGRAGLSGHACCVASNSKRAGEQPGDSRARENGFRWNHICLPYFRVDELSLASTGKVLPGGDNFSLTSRYAFAAVRDASDRFFSLKRDLCVNCALLLREKPFQRVSHDFFDPDPICTSCFQNLADQPRAFG